MVDFFKRIFWYLLNIFSWNNVETKKEDDDFVMPLFPITPDISGWYLVNDEKWYMEKGKTYNIPFSVDGDFFVELIEEE